MISRQQIDEYIKKYFAELSDDILVTRKISNALTRNFLQSEDPSIENLHKYLEQEHIQKFVSHKQPYCIPIEPKIIDELTKFFSKTEWLKGYEIVCVFRASNRREDENLYSVIASKDHMYSCWSSWNANAKILNQGHYGIEELKTAVEILKENFYDITDQTDLYGIEKCMTTVADHHNSTECIPARVR